MQYVIFHRENIFFTGAQIEKQKEQYKEYLPSVADIIFVNNDNTKKIIENTIGKKSEVIKIESEYSYKNLNRANLKKIYNFI